MTSLLCLPLPQLDSQYSRQERNRQTLIKSFSTKNINTENWKCFEQVHMYCKIKRNRRTFLSISLFEVSVTIRIFFATPICAIPVSIPTLHAVPNPKNIAVGVHIVTSHTCCEIIISDIVSIDKDILIVQSEYESYTRFYKEGRRVSSLFTSWMKSAISIM